MLLLLNYFCTCSLLDLSSGFDSDTFKHVYANILFQFGLHKQRVQLKKYIEPTMPQPHVGLGMYLVTTEHYAARNFHSVVSSLIGICKCSVRCRVTDQTVIWIQHYINANSLHKQYVLIGNHWQCAVSLSMKCQRQMLNNIGGSGTMSPMYRCSRDQACQQSATSYVTVACSYLVTLCTWTRGSSKYRPTPDGE